MLRNAAISRNNEIFNNLMAILSSYLKVAPTYKEIWWGKIVADKKVNANGSFLSGQLRIIVCTKLANADYVNLQNLKNPDENNIEVLNEILQAFINVIINPSRTNMEILLTSPQWLPELKVNNDNIERSFKYLTNTLSACINSACYYENSAHVEELISEKLQQELFNNEYCSSIQPATNFENALSQFTELLTQLSKNQSSQLAKSIHSNLLTIVNKISAANLNSKQKEATVIFFNDLIIALTTPNNLINKKIEDDLFDIQFSSIDDSDQIDFEVTEGEIFNFQKIIDYCQKIAFDNYDFIGKNISEQNLIKFYQKHFISDLEKAKTLLKDVLIKQLASVNNGPLSQPAPQSTVTIEIIEEEEKPAAPLKDHSQILALSNELNLEIKAIDEDNNRFSLFCKSDTENRNLISYLTYSFKNLNHTGISFEEKDGCIVHGQEKLLTQTLQAFITLNKTYAAFNIILNAMIGTSISKATQEFIEKTKGKTVIEFMQILEPKILQFPTEVFSQAWIFAQKYYEDTSPNNLFLFKEIQTYKMNQQWFKRSTIATFFNNDLNDESIANIIKEKIQTSPDDSRTGQIRNALTNKK